MKNWIKGIVIGLVSINGFAQTVTDSEEGSKLSIEAQIQYNDPTMDISLTNSSIPGIDLSSYYPTHESSAFLALRGKYNVWNDFSAYAKFGFGNNNGTTTLDAQSSIDPILGVIGSLGLNLPLDPTTVKVNTHINDGYTTINAIAGVSYTYALKKIKISPYFGGGFSYLNTPSTSVDVSFDIDVFGGTANIPLANVLVKDRESASSFIWETGLDITYDINNRFYVGGNFEYSAVNYDFGSTALEFNEDALPGILTAFLPAGTDLSIIPDVTSDLTLDYSAFRYGITIGMRL
ncbi:MAG: hypothetical protein ACPG6V_10345 [Flavobacteriales bacterium]